MLHHMGHIKQKLPLSMRKICEFKLSWTCVRSHPGIFSPLIHSIFSIQAAYNGGPDQTAQMRRLVWAAIVCIDSEGMFLHGIAHTVL